ncbi:MAG: hypothetical protein LCH96_10545 [Actinobacteria bacterium]|nr:hypothetical protein [Actinomycetota bacterium]
MASLTLSAPVDTLDTVCADTPARRATSSIVGPVLRRPRLVVVGIPA